jgi:hypothetical protein
MTRTLPTHRAPNDRSASIRYSPWASRLVVGLSWLGLFFLTLVMSAGLYPL